MNAEWPANFGSRCSRASSSLPRFTATQRYKQSPSGTKEPSHSGWFPYVSGIAGSRAPDSDVGPSRLWCFGRSVQVATACLAGFSLLQVGEVFPMYVPGHTGYRVFEDYLECHRFPALGGRYDHRCRDVGWWWLVRRI